jgi:hypothetical protein
MKIRKKILLASILSTAILLPSCMFRANKVSRYYNNNRALNISLYNDYLVLVKQFPFQSFTARGSSNSDNDVQIRYKPTAESPTQVANYKTDGTFLNGYQDTTSVFKSEIFKRFILNFAKSKYLSASYYPTYGNAVFFAYGNARFNGRDYIGVLISDKDRNDAIKKIESKIYVYEIDVP